MKNRTDLINFIAEKIGAKSYIEIGVYNPDHNFNKIRIDKKVSVDPDINANAKCRMISDRFFDILKITGGKVCLIFIDGLHHADQVKRDIENAWECLAPGGVIILHDCNPPSESTTCVPRGSQREWCGDVYKTICQIISPDFFTVDFDYGCGVLRKKGELMFHDEYPSWDGFDVERKALLNLKSVAESIDIINSWT